MQIYSQKIDLSDSRLEVCLKFIVDHSSRTADCLKNSDKSKKQMQYSETRIQHNENKTRIIKTFLLHTDSKIPIGLKHFVFIVPIFQFAPDKTRIDISGSGISRKIWVSVMTEFQVRIEFFDFSVSKIQNSVADFQKNVSKKQNSVTESVADMSKILAGPEYINFAVSKFQHSVKGINFTVPDFRNGIPLFCNGISFFPWNIIKVLHSFPSFKMTSDNDFKRVSYFII